MNCDRSHNGFTLVETIVGIVVLAISFSVISTLIFPVVEQSADQLHQIRAAELGQSVLNEIQQKAFDDKSDKAGGIDRCGEDYDGSTVIEVEEQCSDIMGSEAGETRASFDDVDDYHELDYEAGTIVDSQGNMLDLYLGYEMSITACNDSDYNGVTTCDAVPDADDNNYTAKLIKVVITTPTGFDIAFSTYRVNF